MIPDAGNRTVSIKLENSLQQARFKYFTTDVVGWQSFDHEDNRYVPMVWNQWLLLVMPLGGWIESVVRQHSHDTDAGWIVTYKGLDTKTINVRVEQP